MPQGLGRHRGLEEGKGDEDVEGEDVEDEDGPGGAAAENEAGEAEEDLLERVERLHGPGVLLCDI